MRSQPPVIAYLGMGSNLGDRKAHLLTALGLLAETDGVHIERTSEFFDNPAIGGPADSPPFLNCVTRIEVTLGAHGLLQRLLDIEHAMGRQRRVKWEPRVIDLDILLFGDEIISSNDLVIPHPLLHERRFVLEPLAQIAPEVVHPVLQMTAKGLLDSLDS